MDNDVYFVEFCDSPAEPRRWIPYASPFSSKDAAESDMRARIDSYGGWNQPLLRVAHFRRVKA